MAVSFWRRVSQPPKRAPKVARRRNRSGFLSEFIVEELRS
jgi:hypothetical protein